MAHTRDADLMIGDPQDMPVSKILGILWGPLEMPLETCNKCGPGELRHRPPHGRDTARVWNWVMFQTPSYSEVTAQTEPAVSSCPTVKCELVWMTHL